MKILFLFLDGVGLGLDDHSINPFARAEMPNLISILNGHRLLLQSVGDSTPTHRRQQDLAAGIESHTTTIPIVHRLETPRATLMVLDACLGVDGLPQSATGQATLLCSQNIPAAIGYHYGPKPNPVVGEFLRIGNLFSTLYKGGKRTSFLNAYPPRYFEVIQSGLRIYSAIPLAVTSAGLKLKDAVDLFVGEALSADFTAQGWRTQLGISDTPVFDHYHAGQHLAILASAYDFSFFEFWLSDYAGHSQNMTDACNLLEAFDKVLGGLVEAWDDNEGLILITSDHGNLEDVSTRRHTRNPVPALLIGAPIYRDAFINFALKSHFQYSDVNKCLTESDNSKNADAESRKVVLNLADISPAILGLINKG